MVGRDSRRAAPKEELGLNGLMPPNPVGCDCRGCAPPADEIDIEGVEPTPFGAVEVLVAVV